MKIILPILLALLLCGHTLAAPSSFKLNSALQQELQINNYADIIVTLRERTCAVLQQFHLQSFKSRGDRLNSVAAALKQHAANSQKRVLEFLSLEPVVVNSFWVSNQISVKGASAELISKLASMNEISELALNEEIPLDKPIDAHTAIRSDSRANEWGIENIQAPQAWDAHFTGEGAIIATVDTGVRFTHESLRDNYANNEYSWYDPYLKTPQPNDQNGHGTHTTSNIAGTHGVGVAHGAKWMACKGCATSSCSTDALIACGQYIICPTKFDGSDEDCTKAPHVVSNSWGAGRGNTFYNHVIDAYHAAGVIPVFSIGNTGPSCSTARSPGEQYVIGVGATTSSNELAYFSSIGPSMHGNHDIKPNVAAPGNSVTAAYHTSDSAYYVMSGTSMACPHTAGVVALLVGANPNLTFEQVRDLLYEGATHDVRPTGKTCGGIPDDQWPNNSYGYGKVNAFNSVQAYLRQFKK